jgi:hypothetical protein
MAFRGRGKWRYVQIDISRHEAQANYRCSRGRAKSILEAGMHNWSTTEDELDEIDYLEPLVEELLDTAKDELEKRRALCQEERRSLNRKYSVVVDELSDSMSQVQM